MKNNIIEDIYKISKNEQYWLFRAGVDAEYFDKFYSRKEIGMGWDKINTLTQMSTKNILDDEVKSKYPLDKTPWNIVNKIHRFHSVMKKGDIIIMPDSGKKRVAFGRLIDDISRVEQTEIMEQKTLLTIRKNETQNEDENKTDPGCINKFRKVKWLKIVEKEKLSPKLLLHLYAPHTISVLAESVRYEVNKLLNDIFIIEDKIYLKYKVDTESDIYADDIKVFFDLVQYAEKITNILEGKEEKIATKMNVNSPGEIMAIATAGAMVILALGYVFNGGKLKIKSKFGDMETGGGKSIFDYLEQRHRHKLDNKKIEMLESLEKKMSEEISMESFEKMKSNLEIKVPKLDNKENK